MLTAALRESRGCVCVLNRNVGEGGLDGPEAARSKDGRVNREARTEKSGLFFIYLFIFSGALCLRAFRKSRLGATFGSAHINPPPESHVLYSDPETFIVPNCVCVCVCVCCGWCKSSARNKTYWVILFRLRHSTLSRSR